MGCTSSAPNTLSAHENEADEGVQQITEDSNETVLKTDIVETVGDIHSAVLPMCDLVETIVNNNKSSISLELEHGFKNHYDNIEPEQNKTTEIPPDPEVETEENLSKLGEVVEKIVELNQNNNVHQSDEKSTEPSSNDVKEERTNEVQVPQETETVVEKENGNDEQEVENAEEDNSEESSDQSEYSHATRWEALADIVAELPPSLAIDPVTGQIYTLTK